MKLKEWVSKLAVGATRLGSTIARVIVKSFKNNWEKTLVLVCIAVVVFFISIVWNTFIGVIQLREDVREIKSTAEENQRRYDANLNERDQKIKALEEKVAAQEKIEWNRRFDAEIERLNRSIPVRPWVAPTREEEKRLVKKYGSPKGWMVREGKENIVLCLVADTMKVLRTFPKERFSPNDMVQDFFGRSTRRNSMLFRSTPEERANADRILSTGKSTCAWFNDMDKRYPSD
jgi:hypothetical protein